MASGPAAICCPSLGLEFWLCMCVSSNLAWVSLGIRYWPGFCWDRSFLLGFQQISLISKVQDAVLSSENQDSCLVFDRVEGFCQEYGTGYNDEK